MSESCNPCGISSGSPSPLFNPNMNLQPPGNNFDKCAADRQLVFIKMPDDTIVPAYQVDVVGENGSSFIRYEALNGVAITDSVTEVPTPTQPTLERQRVFIQYIPSGVVREAYRVDEISSNGSILQRYETLNGDIITSSITEVPNPCDPCIRFVPHGNRCIRLTDGRVINANVVGNYKGDMTLIDYYYYYQGANVSSLMTNDAVSIEECMIATDPLALVALATVNVHNLAKALIYKAWPNPIPAFNIDQPITNLSEMITHWISSKPHPLLNDINSVAPTLSGYAVGV